MDFPGGSGFPENIGIKHVNKDVELSKRTQGITVHFYRNVIKQC